MFNNKKWTDDQFREAVKNNKSIAGVLRYMGLKTTSSNYKSVHTYANKIKLDTSHWTGRGHGKTGGITITLIPMEEILVEKSNYRSMSTLKSRLIRDGSLKNKCYDCGIDPVWNNESLIMVLDHINGNCRDNRLENLRLLCPNCNSQTDTFCGKNIKHKKIECKCKECGNEIYYRSRTGYCVKCRSILIKQNIKTYNCKICGNFISGRSKHNICCSCAKIQGRKVLERPPYEELIKMVKETNMSAVGRKYGVSSNAIKKWIKQYERELNSR